VKHRHKVLVNEVKKRLKELFLKIANDSKFIIVTMKADKDYVHLLVECTPQHYIPDIMKALKGVSARLLIKEFPELKSKLWGGHLWNPSYFAVTVSENTEAQIKEYISKQKEK
jgi:putative transposase